VKTTGPDSSLLLCCSSHPAPSTRHCCAAQRVRSQDSRRGTPVPAGAASSETPLRMSGKWVFEYVKRPFSADFVTLPVTSAHSLLFSSLTPKPYLVLLIYSKTLLSSSLNYLCPVSMDHGFPSIPLGSRRWKQRMRRGIAVHSRHFSTHAFKKT
jgi:hypothetical protein